MELDTVLATAIDRDASDIFLIAGLPLTYKVNGRQERDEEGGRLDAEKIAKFIDDIYASCGRTAHWMSGECVDDDFSFAVPGKGRFRINVFKQRGTLAAVLRVIRFGLPDPLELSIPEAVMRTADIKKGLVLVTGPAGQGKSTTLACLIDHINKTREGHIITMEDPIEFVHRHDRCIVTQREIAIDTMSYATALRAALRETPNVILIGEMRDLDTIETACTAAETGQLLFSTMHTTGAANTIDRIVDVFPANQQHQIRVQLSMVLSAVISEQLIPTIEGGLAPAFEVMYTNPAIRNLIRESKTHQIESAIQAGADEGMCTMDSSLYDLYTRGRISSDNAIAYSMYPEAMTRRLSGTIGR